MHTKKTHKNKQPETAGIMDNVCIYLQLDLLYICSRRKYKMKFNFKLQNLTTTKQQEHSYFNLENQIFTS